MPTAVGVNAAEPAEAVLAAPAVKLIEGPTGVPPAQPVAEGSGPQTENRMDPVGLPAAAVPVTTAVSETDPPSTVLAADGVVRIGVEAMPTATHSLAEPSVLVW